MATPVVLGSSYLGTSTSTLSTVAADERVLLKQVLLCNQDSIERTVSLWNVPSAGAPGDANAVLVDAPLPVGTSIFDLSMVMSEGDTLQAVAEAAGVISVRASGLSIPDTAQPLPTVLSRGLLGSSPAVLYTSTGVTTVITHISVCNTSASARTFSLYLVPSGESQGDEYALWKEEAVPANTSVFLSMAAPMDDGDVLYGEADVGSALCAIASGVAA